MSKPLSRGQIERRRKRERERERLRETVRLPTLIVSLVFYMLWRHVRLQID